MYGRVPWRWSYGAEKTILACDISEMSGLGVLGCRAMICLLNSAPVAADALARWMVLADQASGAIFLRWWMLCVCVSGITLSGPDHSAPLFWPFPICVPGASFSHCFISQGSPASHVVPGHVYVLFQLLWTLWPLLLLLSKSVNRVNNGWV